MTRGLLVLTRDPTGDVSGRKAVLATIARSLEALGVDVVVVVLSRSAPSSSWKGRRVVWVRLPGLLAVAWSMALVAVGRGSTYNEALFDSRRVRRQVRRAARDLGATFVVADTLRTAGPAVATGLPLVVHLDDLLSDRYRDLSQHGRSDSEVLGFFGEQLPARVRGVASALAARLLRAEADHVARRELELARTAQVVAMTSPAEAAELQRRSGRPVAALPMAVDVLPVADIAAATSTSMVFLGLMSYSPNIAAIRWWRERVRPALDAIGGQDVVLTVIGRCEPALEQELSDDRLLFLGYVPDLASELRRHRGMLAPVTSGSGMKTKVLDGFSVGLPVVATSLGVSGLSVVDGHHAHVADTPEDFAGRVLHLVRDAEAAIDLGMAGRALLASTWSTAEVTRRWANVLADLSGEPHEWQLREGR